MMKKKVNCVSLFEPTILFLLVILVKTSMCDEYRTIKTKNGLVRGIRKTTLIKKVDFYSFKGIRYGKSPTGDLRFKAPEPVDSWAKTLDAFEYGNICPQGASTNEDCLFLNVFVPVGIKSFGELPVMVFIFGGAYLIGSGNDDYYGPDFLLEQKVIVVTMNYRVGVFGFLDFNTPKHSGNMGLKDQQLALKWVHENIKEFSGDNKRITLFGESAGASSTQFQVLSRESRKYFRNAIQMSGTVDEFWAFNDKNDHLNLINKIAKDLNATQNSKKDLIKFLKSVPAANLTAYGSINTFYERTVSSALAPVIERKNAIRPIITEHPDKIYQNERIQTDVMFGFNSLEYLYFYVKAFSEVYNFDDLDKNFTLTLPFRNVNLSFNSEKYKKIASEIRGFYFGKATINKNVLRQYIELLSDLNFVYGVDKAAKKHAAKSAAKAYYYRFSVDSELNVAKKVLSSAPNLAGASHADEICYLFRCGAAQAIYAAILSNPKSKQSITSLNAIENMTKLVADFAKFGKPPQMKGPGYWSIRKDRTDFLDITNDGFVPGQNPNRKANEFWAHIEKQAYGIK